MRKLKRILLRKLYPAAVAYDVFIKRTFSNEVQAAYAGVKRHHAQREELSSRGFVRRHVHMLEKGLVMRPRRDTFAEGYIIELVNSYIQLIRSEDLDVVSQSWIQDVLSHYFEATSKSPSKIIKSARALFEQYENSLAYDDKEPRKNLGPVRAAPRSSAVSIDEFGRLADDRKSVRWFQQRSVPREIVDRALEAGIQAPSACNRIPYRFEIYDDPRDAVALASIVGGTAGYVDNLQALVVVVGDLSSYAHVRDRHLIYIDASLATMSFLFGLEVQNVSSCCINWPDTRSQNEKIGSLLSLLPYERVVMLIAYGYADPEGFVPGSGKTSMDSARAFRALSNRSSEDPARSTQ